MLTIRASVDEDIPTITQIYNHYILQTNSTLELTALTTDEMNNRRVATLSRDMPYLVAQHEGSVVGYAYCDWFKLRSAYRFTAEVSIFLHQDMCGKGFGRQLLTALISEAEKKGVRKLIAGIGDPTNERSFALHHSCGFTHVATFKSAGWKFNRWLDVTFLERSIGEGDRTAPE